MSLVWQSVLLLDSFIILLCKEMRIATPACALVRNDRLGGAVGLIGSARVPAGAREGHDPPLRAGSGARL